ncbi:MAG: hypothetical protein H6680_04530, partial [Desulfobacteraceae bacterium]|nr:hypothetical protein [Desulfobacteraceae bacterium]
MKKHIYFISALVFFSFMSLVYPLHYHFFSEPVKELPEFTTYKQAVTEILPKKIYEKAGEYKCGDYIIPVSDVEGLPQSLEFVPDDINLAVQTFSGWKLLVDEDLKNKMKKRVEQRISVWGNMGIGREIGNILKTQKNAAMNTRYSIDAKCFELKDKKTDNIKLIV